MGVLKSIGKRDLVSASDPESVSASDAASDPATQKKENRSGAREIGAFLRAKRQESQFSLNDVSRHLEIVSQEALFNYESGANPIPLEILFALANLYSILPDQLIHMLYQQALGRSTY